MFTVNKLFCELYIPKIFAYHKEQHISQDEQLKPLFSIKACGVGTKL